MDSTMLTISLAATLLGGAFCDRPAPEPRSFHSRGFGYVAEVFPPRSRQNPGERPVAYLYAVGYPGRGWDLDARLVASVTLPHEESPAEAVVSQAGHLVTLDDYYKPGEANAVVLVDSVGHLVGAYALTDLLHEDEILAVGRSDCGIQWRDGARYYFLLQPVPRFYIVLSSGLVLEFRLGDGAFGRGRAGAFPDLLQVMGQDFANEEVAPWATSLRFSSITDVLGAR